MKNFTTIILISAICSSCSVKPEPLRFSKDSCHFCKMTLMDDKFGGELVTSKGKIFKFDDIKCMTAFLNSSEGRANEYSYELTVDYAHAADEFDLIPVNDAFFVRSAEAKSPMAGNVAAFKNQVEQTDYQKKWGAETLTWAQVKESFK